MPQSQVILPLPAGQHSFTFNDFTVTIETPPDFDALLDACARDTPDNVDRIPYYANLWPSAIGLAHSLCHRASAIANSTVIELGCGLGLPSIVAAQYHAANVVATDFHPDTQPWLLHNATLNQTTITFTTLDWNTPSPLNNATFDWIIGSDLLYESRHIPALANCITTLAHPATNLLIADPGRDGLAAFTAALTRHHWHCDLETVHNIYIITARR